MRYLDAFDRAAAAHAGRADDIARWGLGLVVLLAGAHKLVAPGVWSAYAAPQIVALWPLAMDATMVANGAVEVVFGLAVLADRYTALAAAVIAVSLVGVLLDLALVAATTGEFVDVAIRDLGLTALAVAVALRSAALHRA